MNVLLSWIVILLGGSAIASVLYGNYQPNSTTTVLLIVAIQLSAAATIIRERSKKE